MITGRITRSLVVALVCCTAWLAGCSKVAPISEKHKSPNGKRVLIVREYPDMIDMMYPIQLRVGWRAIDVGCVNGDYTGIKSVRWLDDSTVELALFGWREDEVEIARLHITNEGVTEDPSSELLHSC